MSITIKEVSSKKELRTFIYLPANIHKNHKNWLHPLYVDEWKLFSKNRNPGFAHCTTILLLAYKGEIPVGRIMGIIPHEYNKIHTTNTARFAFFETIDDINVFNALIKEIEAWAKANGCKSLIGPMGFSDKDPQGFLVKGFDKETMMVTNCSFEYMKNYIESYGFSPFVHLCQYTVPITSTITEHYKNYIQRVENRMDIVIHEFKTTSSVKPFVRPVFKLINATYQKIYGFTTLTEAEMDEFGTRFLPFLNPKLIKIITDLENNVVAFVIAMPDMSYGLRKAKGKLFPIGWFHILKAAKKSKRLVLLLGGIEDSMQNKGLDAVLGTRLLNSAIELGYTLLDSHLIMDNNYKMKREIEKLDNYELYKEYEIYSKAIE